MGAEIAQACRVTKGDRADPENYRPISSGGILDLPKAKTWTTKRIVSYIACIRAWNDRMSAGDND